MKKLLVTSAIACVALAALPAVADPPIPQTPAPQTPPPQPGVVPPPPSPTASSTTTLTSASTQGEGVVTPVPPPREPEKDVVTIYQTQRPNRAYLYTGGILFLGSYVPTAAVAAANGRDSDRNLWIPVVGPWLNLADRQCDGCSNEEWNDVLIAASGVGQGIGVLMVGASLLVPEHVPTATIQAGNVRMNVMPANLGRNAAGLGAVGTF